jgi:perosamine synthetase
MDAGKLARFLADECETRAGGCYNRRTGRRVRAVLPVHILGLACEIERIVALAREHGLAVVEDAAEAMGVRIRGRHAGTFGDIGVFSFNGNKIITTGGGGILATDDPDRAKRARYLSTQAKDDELEYVHHEVGYNYRLTNIQAAIGLAQMEQLDTFVAQRRATAAAYARAFADLPGVSLMPTPAGVEPTFWLYTILLRDGTTLDERKALLKKLHALGVGARPLWHPIHSLAPYRDCQAFEITHAPRLYARAVSLPSSAGMAREDLQRCIDAVRQAVEG